MLVGTTEVKGVWDMSLLLSCPWDFIGADCHCQPRLWIPKILQAMIAPLDLPPLVQCRNVHLILLRAVERCSVHTSAEAKLFWSGKLFPNSHIQPWCVSFQHHLWAGKKMDEKEAEKHQPLSKDCSKEQLLTWSQQHSPGKSLCQQL